MSDDYAIVLSDDLLKIFWEFKHGNSEDNQTIQKLLNYYKSPHITNTEQLKRIGIDNAPLLSLLAQSSLTHQTLAGLCDKTTFKIILNQTKDDYPYVNILGDTLENNYSSTFYREEPRVKAQEHIKTLLKDADRIFIYDEHLIKQWNTSKKFFQQLVPKKDLTIYYKENHLKQSNIGDLKKIYGWNIQLDMINDKHVSLHDRYLIIDNKIEIILTSGFDYLFDESKDFTYIIRKK